MNLVQKAKQNRKGHLGGSNLVIERTYFLKHAHLNFRKEVTSAGFEPAKIPSGRPVYTLGYCPWFQLWFKLVLYETIIRNLLFAQQQNVLPSFLFSTVPIFKIPISPSIPKNLVALAP